ncbi:hypothetical protein Hanom_Chr13g01202171 [Helianthus anomalus]
MSFGHIFHFSSKLKSFASGSLWFEFYCHFRLKVKSDYIYLIKCCYFVIFLMGKMIILIFIKKVKEYILPTVCFQKPKRIFSVF